MSNINIGGLVSGIDTDTIIAGMLKIQQQQIDQFDVKKTGIQTKQQAYQELQTQLVALRTSAISLASPTSNPFDARTVNVSNPNAVVASGSAKATAGTYQIKINSLASSHQIASQNFADEDSPVTEGTLTIRVGEQAPVTITVDNTNNSLSGLANTINYSNSGVTASIVRDASGSSRLLLTATKTGTANEISITNNLAEGNGAALKPTFDFDQPVQAASDASVTLGSGSGALTVTSSTNTVSTLINGVSLNLLDADPAKTVSITVANDTEKSKTAITDFVTAYNSLLDFVDSQTKYDSAADVGGILQGEYSAINVRSQLQSVMQSVIPGGNSKVNRLSTLGISTSNNGRLVINQTQLDNVLSGNATGATSADLRHLFALDGKGNNSNISFLYATAKTQGSITPYEVVVTQAAQQASVSAGAALSETTTIDGTNDTLKINLDGVEAEVTLAHGEYSRDDLAKHTASIINNHSSMNGRTISVGLNAGNQLQFTSDTYGGSSRVTLYSSSATAALGLSGGESSAGKDVAGHFVVDGKVEAATGSGRTLTGKEGNTNTDGLQIRVTLTAAQVAGGASGEITVTRGVASRLNTLIDKMMDSQKGMLTTLNKSLQDQISGIQKSLDTQQAMFDRQKDALLTRFSAMESALQKLKSTSSLLGAQLQGIQGIS